MAGFADWVTRRRKLLGFERQQDFADAAYLSLSTVSSIENNGSLEGRERSIKKLLSLALKVSMEDLERLARGEIEDSPIREEGDLVTQLGELASDNGEKLRARIIPQLSAEASARLAKIFIERVIQWQKLPLPAAIYPTEEIRNQVGGYAQTVHRGIVNVAAPETPAQDARGRSKKANNR